MTTTPISRNPAPRQRLRRRVWPSLILVLLALFFLLPIVSAQDDDFDDGSDDSGGHTDDPELTGAFPPLDDPIPSPASVPSPPAPAVSPDDASPSVPSPTKSKIPKPTIALPTVLYMPPTAPNMNAIDPLFPPGSESCQKCKYFYPKLKECNQIAQQTLGRLPRFPPGSGSSASSSSTSPLSPSPSFTVATTISQSNPLSAAATGTTSAATATTAASSTTIAAPATNNTTAPAEFTTLMPFLQCICPNQGLAATKVCLTCFRITNQRNFLDQLVVQNVSNSLSAFQEACLDSGDGKFVPPASNKGQSASDANDASLGTVVSFWSTWVPIITFIFSTIYFI